VEYELPANGVPERPQRHRGTAGKQDRGDAAASRPASEEEPHQDIAHGDSREGDDKDIQDHNVAVVDARPPESVHETGREQDV